MFNAKGIGGDIRWGAKWKNSKIRGFKNEVLRIPKPTHSKYATITKNYPEIISQPFSQEGYQGLGAEDDSLLKLIPGYGTKGYEEVRSALKKVKKEVVAPKLKAKLEEAARKKAAKYLNKDENLLTEEEINRYGQTSELAEYLPYIAGGALVIAALYLYSTRISSK